MKRLIFAPEAQKDLRGINDYIAIDDAQAAQRLIDRIQKRCGDLIGMPNAGRRCDELLPDLRHVSEGDYLIFYRPLRTFLVVYISGVSPLKAFLNYRPPLLLFRKHNFSDL